MYGQIYGQALGLTARTATMRKSNPHSAPRQIDTTLHSRTPRRAYKPEASWLGSCIQMCQRRAARSAFCNLEHRKFSTRVLSSCAQAVLNMCGLDDAFLYTRAKHRTMPPESLKLGMTRFAEDHGRVAMSLARSAGTTCSQPSRSPSLNPL